MSAGSVFRWGLTCLALVPFALLAWWVFPVFGGLAGWIALGLILLGGALNLFAIARGVRGLRSWGKDLDGMTEAPALAPRQRILYPEEPEAEPDPRVRRLIGAGAALALLGLIAFGAWTLAIEQPLAIAQGRLTLEETYAAWNTVSQTGFFVALTVWAIIGVAISAGVFVLSRIDGPVVSRLLSPPRFLALCAIAGSVIVAVAAAPYFAVGISLPDDLPFFASGVLSPGSVTFGLLGFALSATAIVLTVPSWKTGVTDTR